MVPLKVPFLPKVKQFSSSANHTGAVTLDNVVMLWGDNSYNKVGAPEKFTISSLEN